MFFFEKGDEYEFTQEEIKYLSIKQHLFIQKLKEKYSNIVTMTKDDDLGTIRIGFIEWGPDHKIFLYLGNKNQSSYWIQNVQFRTQVHNNSSIGPCHLNDEFHQFCIILDKLYSDFLQQESSLL